MFDVAIEREVHYRMHTRDCSRGLSDEFECDIMYDARGMPKRCQYSPHAFHRY